MLCRARRLAGILLAVRLLGLASPARAQSFVFASGSAGIALPAGPALVLAVGADLGRVRASLSMTETYRVVRSSPGLFGPPRESRTMNVFLAHAGRVRATGSDRRALVAGVGAARVKRVDRDAPAGTPSVRVHWTPALGVGAGGPGRSETGTATPST